jgi:anti-sigma factor RsiW
MSGSDRLREIDLLAYADGLLDSDPLRKAEVETYLREHPTEAARVHAYMEQNAQIRAHFEQVLEEPVPPRLKTAVEPHVAAIGARRVAQLGIAVSLMLAVAAVGWWLGVTMQGPSPQVQGFLHQAVSTYRLGEQGGPPDLAPVKASLLGWFSERIAPELQPPDLSDQGYTLVDRRLMTRGGRHAVQLNYANAQGHRINLVWGTRWQEDEIPKLRIMEDGEVMVAYWLDGPMIYGLVGQLKRDQLLELAKTVRRSLRLIQDTGRYQVNSSILSEAGARTTVPEDSHHMDPKQPPSPSGRM